MPRPRNEELHRRVTATAFDQLLTRGIAATSYASVASACGTTRAVVQDYYPRKNDMLGALSKALNDIAMQVTLAAYETLDISDEQAKKVGHLFLSGSAYFEYMQRAASRRDFLRELLRDRDQTESLISSVMYRSFDEIGRLDVVDDPAYRNDLIMSIGGFYELFYDHLKHGVHFDPTLYFGQMTRVWMHAAGFSREQTAEVLRACEAALEDINALAARMERAVDDLLAR